MGISQSRSDEWAVDRLGNRIMRRSVASDSQSTYSDKPRSVSSNAVLLDRNGNANDRPPPPSNNSTSSSFRSKMSLLKKPRPISTKNSKTSASTNGDAKTTSSNSNPIVDSFTTNMSFRGIKQPSEALSSGQYGRSAASGLPLRTTAKGNDSGNAGLRRLYSSRGQQSVGINSYNYGRPFGTVLQIPSPVPSITEPSASETNLSIETLETETDTKDGEGSVQLRHVDSPSQTSANNSHFISAGLLSTTTANTTGGVPSGPFTRSQSLRQASSIKERPLSTSYSYGYNYAPKRPLHEEPQSMNDSVSPHTPVEAQTDAVGLSAGDNQEPATNDDGSHRETVSVATAAEHALPPRPPERPKTLEKSLPTIIPQRTATRFSSKLRYKGEAPLAQSESFTVENSPALESPPSTNNGSLYENNLLMEKDQEQSGMVVKLNNNEPVIATNVKNDGAVWKTGIAVAPRIQSRLKNPSTYEHRQRNIYGRYGAQVMKADKLMMETNAKRSDMDSTKLAISTAKPDKKCSNVPTTAVGANTSGTSEKPTKDEMGKKELHDSGVKVETCCSGSSGSGSKATSPEGSLSRGLIDDEIRDQPELTFGRSDGDADDQASQATTLVDEIPQVEHSGPVRLRDRIRVRSNTTDVTNRMIESYDSTVSSLSINSEDLMVDYESVEGEESDLVGGTDNAGARAPLGCRSSIPSRSGTVGSLGRTRKPSSVSAVGKRASVDDVMNELLSLKNQSEKGSNHSQQRQRALSDFPSPSSGAASPGHRVLRPPLSLECAGLSTFSLDQQAYRHMVQDVTVMKTLLLRLKRSLQETETTNPFETSMALKNGLAKSALIDLEMQKNQETLSQLTKDDLKEENSALRTQVAIMRQQLEEQTRIIQCLQQQLKLCRQRSLRKSDSVGDSPIPKELDKRKPSPCSIKETSGSDDPHGKVKTDIG